jgi:tubulin polyglutamylase TTLL7
MGDYQRIYPSNDPQRQLIYENLIQDSMQIGFAGKSYQNRSLIRGLEKMKEKELLDLLSQYETEEKFSCVPTNVSWLHDAVPYTTGSLASFQPSIYYDSSPREVEMNVIAAREHEEEQTQRTMLALNTLRPSYPGKSGEDVKAIIEKIQSDWSNQYAKVGSFWLLTLDGTKRKQLLNPIRECARNLIKIHWRTTAIETTRLNKVFMRLFNYLLSNHGQGLWSTIPGDSEKEQWEKSFQKKYEILSMSELHCCRRLAELCQSTVIAAYYYHDFLTDKKKSSQIPVRRKSDIPLRPPSVYAAKRPSVVQLYGKSKSKSVPSVIISKVTRL